MEAAKYGRALFVCLDWKLDNIHPNKNKDIHSMEVVIIVGKPSRKFLFLLPLDSSLPKAKLPDM